MRTMLAFILFGLLILASEQATAQRLYSVSSPDERLQVKVETGKTLAFSVELRRHALMSRSLISLTRGDRPAFGPSSRVVDASSRSVSEEIRPVLPEKRSTIPDVYNELILTFEEGFSVEFRAYDDAIAYRFRMAIDGDVEILDEGLEWAFSPGDTVFFPREDSFFSHYERLYLRLDAGNIADSMFCSLPALVTKKNGVQLFLSEADVSGYPGLFLRGTGAGSTVLRGVFPRYPLEETAKNDRDVVVTKEASYIARTSGTRAFPWRVIGVAERDADLLVNDVVYRLGKPLALDETDWIKPGKVAWDWWNANNVYGVPFRSGLNTATYKYYIDFASRYGIEYIILDEGWTEPGDLSKVNPHIDVHELFAYAKEKNVGIIPWVLWNALEKDMEGTLDRFAGWGAKGVKVDFMQRHDQRMVEYYERVVREAAKRKLLVDFHGAYKPDGLRRAYPNALTREGVRGGEWNKWSAHITPPYNVTLPFIRMVAGPMDYTPGATINVNAEDFRAVFSRPMSQGSRCHQLAMYVVYESPLQMLCDNPSNYLREPEMMEFLSAVPTVWHETIVQEANVGEFVIVARRNGERWFLGGMTDWTSRSFTVELGFLGEGTYVLSYWADGANADRFGNDTQTGKKRVTRSDTLRVAMTSGGGWVGVLEKEKN